MKRERSNASALDEVRITELSTGGTEPLDKALAIEKPQQGLDQSHDNYPPIGDLVDLELSGRLDAP